MAIITTNKIQLDEEYIREKSGILNSLTFASAQYIFKVLEKHCKSDIKWFDGVKVKKLKRTIIHKNAHLDEYFAELLFRAILPPYLKDIEVCEHVLMSQDDDTFAKISWTNGVVFGIHSDETGGAKALAFFDEHTEGGGRKSPSCSQLVAEEFLGKSIPASIQKVLDEVNLNDSNKGAHQFHFAHVIKELHYILLCMGKNDGGKISKYLNENWKRGIIDSVITSLVYVFENDLGQTLTRNSKEVLATTEDSFNYFVKHNTMTNENYYSQTLGYYKQNILNIHPIITAKWKADLAGTELPGKDRLDQILIVQRVAYALKLCWGDQIAKFVMMHVWSVLFQRQINFYSVQEKLDELQSDNFVSGEFGNIYKYEILNSKIIPSASGKRSSFKEDSTIYVLCVELTNPTFSNITKPVQNFLNNDYEVGGNQGFGVFMIHDKIVNSIYINSGATFPKEAFNKLAFYIESVEPDKWYLFRPQGGDVEFILNRTKGHQDQLPSELVNKEFLVDAIKKLF